MSRPLALLFVALFACHSQDTEAPGDEPVIAAGSLRLILHDPTPFERPPDACDTEHCIALVELLDGARHTIDFAIYGMRNQTRVLEAMRAAKARGVRIRGVVDRDRAGENYYASTEEMIAVIGDVRSDRNADRKLDRQAGRDRNYGEPGCERPPGLAGPLQCLAYDLGESCLLAAHASVEPIDGGEAIMHDKFFVVDDRFVWTGSSNISDSDSGGYSANLVTVVDAEPVADAYREEFEQMYEQGRYHTLKRSNGRRRVRLGNTELEVMFSPQDAPIRTAVRPLIKRAKDRIDIAVFFLTHKYLAEDLIAAHRRGVRVRVILDATGATNGYTKHELLRAAGIPVKVEHWGGKMHMKSAVIDGRTVVTGSMNWTSAGESSNDENTILVHSETHAAQYEAFFEQIWGVIPDRWLHENPDPESLDSSSACRDGIDNDFDHLKDRDDPGCSETPPPLPPLPPWRIVPKGGRMTCEIGMDR